MCYSLRDRELEAEARRRRQNADSARRPEEKKEKALTEEVWELVSGVG